MLGKCLPLPLNDLLMVHAVACCAAERDKICRISSCCMLKLQNHHSASPISQSFLENDYNQAHPVFSPLFLVDPEGCQFQARHVFNLFGACYCDVFQILQRAPRLACTSRYSGGTPFMKANLRPPCPDSTLRIRRFCYLPHLKEAPFIPSAAILPPSPCWWRASRG